MQVPASCGRDKSDTHAFGYARFYNIKAQRFQELGRYTLTFQVLHPPPSPAMHPLMGSVRYYWCMELPLDIFAVILHTMTTQGTDFNPETEPGNKSRSA